MMPSPPPDHENQPLRSWWRHGGSFLVLALTGCSPDSLSTTDTDVVITVRDLGRSYASYQTYALPDAVIDVCSSPALGVAGAAGAGGSPSDEDCLKLNHEHDEEILDTIRANLDELGFTEAEPDDDPDVMILAAAIAEDSWYVYDRYCDYWYGYCFDYAWGPTAVSYPLGTLAMYMVSWRDANHQTGTVPVIWLGVVSGLLVDARELGSERIESTIGQAFAQSSYLGEGK